MGLGGLGWGTCLDEIGFDGVLGNECAIQSGVIQLADIIHLDACTHHDVSMVCRKQ